MSARVEWNVIWTNLIYKTKPYFSLQFLVRIVWKFTALQAEEFKDEQADMNLFHANKQNTYQISLYNIFL